MTTRPIERFLESQRWLEGLADALQKAIGWSYDRLGVPGRGLATFLHGTWLGHPLHPLITDVPVGAWTVGVLVDIIYLVNRGHGFAISADIIIAAGLVAALGAAVTGFTDWRWTVDRERRTGLAHGLLNSAAILLYAASLGLRLSGGSRISAIVISWVGYVVLSVAAYLGGELTFNMGTGVNHHAWQAPPTEWTPVLKVGDLLEAKLEKVSAVGTPILLYKKGVRICAISETCSHAGGPLSEGTVEGDSVVCPWHFSRFDLCSGAARVGPATIAQVRYETRVAEGWIEVRRSSGTLQLA